MPSDLSYWIISAPLKDGDPNVMLEEVRGVLGGEATAGAFEVPELKVSWTRSVVPMLGDMSLFYLLDHVHHNMHGAMDSFINVSHVSLSMTAIRRSSLTNQTGTLSNLLTLSDQLPKLDSQFTGIVSKLLDTLRGLLDDQSKLSQHARVNDQSAETYLLPDNNSGWKWDAGRWGSGGKVAEVVDALTKVIGSGYLAVGRLISRRLILSSLCKSKNNNRILSPKGL